MDQRAAKHSSNKNITGSRRPGEPSPALAQGSSLVQETTGLSRSLYDDMTLIHPQFSRWTGILKSCGAPWVVELVVVPNSVIVPVPACTVTD